MKDNLQKPEPYSDIPKLPKLIEDFSSKYTEFLEEKYKPIHDSIVNCRDRVLKELTGKSFEKEFKDKYNDYKLTDIKILDYLLWNNR